MKRHHRHGEAPEHRVRDQQRTHAVHDTLAAAGIPMSHEQAHTYVRVEMPDAFHAVDLQIWTWPEGSGTDADADALADRIDKALWARGYLVHRPASYGTIHAYRPHWGGNLPEITVIGRDAATHLGIQPSTWRSYVARGQAPQPDGHHSPNLPYWNTSTVDLYRRNRPGQGARTDIKETGLNAQDLADQIRITFGDHADDFDIPAIVEEIGDTYGRDIPNIDAVPTDEYWKIVERHDITAD